MPYWRRRFGWYKPRYYRSRYFRRFTTRRPRRPLRRRRRRRKYFRRVRKRKTLTLKQWNPPYTKNCKIKGQLPVIICGQGRQQYNFTQHRDEVVPAKMSGGGSFAVLVFNLGFLWDEHEHWRNIWTASNENYDLCRYTGLTLKVFRPPSTDVILTITRHYPMLTNSGTHPACHPQRQLLQYKKYIIESLQRKPHGRKYKKIKVKPPALLNNRWFFQRDFINTNLCMISIATADLTRPFCHVSGDNNCTGFNALNTDIFHNIAWQLATTSYIVQEKNGSQYKLYGFTKTSATATSGTWNELIPLKPYGPENPFYSAYLTGKAPVAMSTTKPTDMQGNITETTTTHNVTGKLLTYCRYNPTPDIGDTNIMYLKGMFTKNSLEPSLNLSFSLQGLPLWLLSYGYFDWMVKLHSTYNIYDNYQVVIQSKFIASIPPITYRQSGNNELKYAAIIPVSPHFINGRGINDTDPLPLEQKSWYPKVTNQTEAINYIVTTGPYIPMPNKEFSWCVQLNYTAYFKWGGTHHPSQEIDNPATKGTYPVPSTMLKGVQVKNPRKTLQIHPWHWRRDELTTKAVKRMLQYTDSSTDSESFTDSPKKKKKTSSSDPKPYIPEDYDIQEEYLSGTNSSDQEETPQEILQQQLQQQLKEQQVLRQFLFRKLKDLTKKQRSISILTGPMD
nr:MAG: ORF1 [Torque teno midi virus]